MSPLVAFMGSPQFALPSLRRLVEGDYEVVGVYTQPDREAGRGRKLTPPPAKVLAEAYGLKVFQPPSLRRPEAIAQLASLRPDVIVVAAYGQILSQAVLDIPARGAVNVHPSLLPRHRGASPVAAAILSGDQETGVTIMLTDVGMDTGPILSQRRTSIEALDTTGTLTTRLADLGADLLLETLPLWLAGQITPQPQEDSLATYAPLLRKEEGLIDWSRPATAIWRRIRGYNPWPGAYTTLSGETLHLWEAWPLSEDTERPPGTVLSMTREQGAQIPPAAGRAAFGIQTGQGVLAILKVQLAGRRALTADEFLRGRRNLVGTRLA